MTFDESGFLLGHLSDRVVDPFEATADRLLLAESFARVDLADRDAAAAWFVQHGALDLRDWSAWLAAQPEEYGLEAKPPSDIADRLVDVAAEQGNVRWHLDTLARLSERREEMDWDPAFGQLIIESPDGRLVVGSPEAGAQLLSDPGVELLSRVTGAVPGAAKVAARQARRREATRGWPTVAVGHQAWLGHWRPQHLEPAVRMPDEAKALAKILGSTWDEAVELERILMAPYVERAMDRRFVTWRTPIDLEGKRRMVLVAHEARLWRSILAPMYLQLFEALQRITLGQPGAAICRECHQPFLVLDARRRLFCNARERYRFTQRERRRRISDSTVPGSA